MICYMPELENLTETESKTINTLGLVCALIVILTLVILMFSHFSHSTKHVRNIMYGLSILYLVLVFITCVVYFSYRNNKASVSDETDMVAKPALGLGIAVAIVALILHLTDKVVPK